MLEQSLSNASNQSSENKVKIENVQASIALNKVHKGVEETPPTYCEIQRSLQVIKKIIPEAINDELVNIIFSRATAMLNKCTQGSKQAGIEKDPVLSANERQIDLLIANAYYQGICDYYSLLDQSLQPLAVISKQIYNSRMSKLMIEVYKKLENMVQPHRQLVTLNSSQEKSIIEILTYSHKHFKPDIYQTVDYLLKSFVEEFQCLTNFEQSIALYQKIHEKAKEKKKLFEKIASHTQNTRDDTIEAAKTHSFHGVPYFKEQLRKTKLKFELHNSWNDQYQRQLLQCYKVTNNFGNIRDRFKLKYPRSEKMFTSESLRSKLYKIIRVAIRKLVYQIENFYNCSTPNLIKLDDNRVKAIIYYQEGREIKLGLLQLYTTKEYDKKLVVKMILAINEYIARLERSYNASSSDSTAKISISKRKKKRLPRSEKKKRQAEKIGKSVQQSSYNQRKQSRDDFDDLYYGQSSNDGMDWLQQDQQY